MKRRNFMGALAAGAALGADFPVLRIAAARLYHFHLPVESAVRTSFGVMNERHLVLLELVDQDGNRGYGESWTNFPAWAPTERIAAFKTAYLPYLAGKQVANSSQFVLEMARAFRGPALQSGTMGPLAGALCAVNMAVAELAARRKNVPLNRLLFANPAQRVRIYGSGINAPLPWKLIDSYLERGVSLFKLKLGFNDAGDLKNLTDLKRHLGNRARVAVDVNRNWTFQQAAGWLKKLADLDVQWLEEPLRVEEEPRLAELASLGTVPLAGGENILLEPGGDISAFSGAPFAILQPDVTKYCTTGDFLRLLPEAPKRAKRVIPHLLGSAPGQAFAIHLASGCPGEHWVEWDINANPLHTDFFAEPLNIAGGAISIPETPGLGWTPKLTAKNQVA